MVGLINNSPVVGPKKEAKLIPAEAAYLVMIGKTKVDVVAGMKRPRWHHAVSHPKLHEGHWRFLTSKTVFVVNAPTRTQHT